MTFQQIASELVHQVYSNLSTISDVINLSLTCRRFNILLRNCHKLTTLFAAADREFGPIEDIIKLVTYTQGQDVQTKRNPPLSYALLRQVITVGLTGKRFSEIYPAMRWDTDFINRRGLTYSECYSIRCALYRYWLYSDAFHNRFYPRTSRLMRSAIENRCGLLRNWSTEDLINIEEIRLMFEDILAFELCPTDGTVRSRLGKDIITIQWQNPLLSCPTIRNTPHTDYFHTKYHQDMEKLSINEEREKNMEGWGDEISQYHTVQSMLKLNPAHLIWLHDHAVYKWDIESMVKDLGEDWFWNNGQTFSDTWSLILHTRGLDVDLIRNGILSGIYGITPNIQS